LEWYPCAQWHYFVASVLVNVHRQHVIYKFFARGFYNTETSNYWRSAHNFLALMYKNLPWIQR